MEATQTRRGITRLSARNLALSLTDSSPSRRHAGRFIGGDENLLAIPSSRWTMTPGPKSSASMYSQESYTNSPVYFSEARIDRRRFGIAISPSEDNPWGQTLVQSPQAPVFVLALPSGAIREGGASSIGNNINREIIQLKGDDIREKRERRDTVGEVKLKKVYSTAQLRVATSKSTKVFEKMLSRFSAHPSLHHNIKQANVEERPSVLLNSPPRILVSLPSPGLNMNSDVHGMSEAVDAAVESHISFNKPAGLRDNITLPSTWKPKRPPSPLPQSLRRKNIRNKHKRSASVMPLDFIRSPPPPLPSLRKSMERLSGPPEDVYPNLDGLLTPFLLEHNRKRPKERDKSDDEKSVQVYLRARALKTATFAIHDGGIISPP